MMERWSNLGAWGLFAGQPLVEDHGTRCVFGERGPDTKVAGTDASDSTMVAISYKVMFADDQWAIRTHLCPH